MCLQRTSKQASCTVEKVTDVLRVPEEEAALAAVLGMASSVLAAELGVSVADVPKVVRVQWVQVVAQVVEPVAVLVVELGLGWEPALVVVWEAEEAGQGALTSKSSRTHK